MIKTDKEIYSSPYYFFLKEKGNDYSLYFSVENTLTEARKKDKMVKIPKDKLELIKKYINKVINSKKKKSSSEVEGEIDELVSLDGALMNSKIPILDPMVHPTKTMDQTVVAARITNDPITRGYRTYYGESVEEEMKEEDMSGAFGYEETKDLDGKETYEYFKDELELEPDDAKDRTEQQGKDYTGKKDKSSEFYDDPNLKMKVTIAEIQRQKAIKMLEDMLAKKKSTDSADIGKKETGEEVELPSLVKKNLKSLIKQAEKQGLSRKDLIKLIQSE
jgi:hypothetical protein